MPWPSQVRRAPVVLSAVSPVIPGYSRRGRSRPRVARLLHIERGHRIEIRPLRSDETRGEIEPGVCQTSLVAILHAPKTVHTTSQAAITATAMAVDSGSNDDGSRRPAGPFTIP